MEVTVASSESLASEVAEIINAAYAVGEDGLWVEGTTRTDPEKVAGMIRSGGVLVAMRDGEVVGCASVRPLDASTAELGFISSRPENWGGGIGRQLVRGAEELMRSRGATEMQLELLVPKEGVHPAKERLRDWYERLGYRVVRTAPFEEIATHPADDLAKPCEFLIFRKPLSETA
jgi:ribosomal protein S18 acetylase RimI-like enzyme